MSITRGYSVCGLSLDIDSIIKRTNKGPKEEKKRWKLIHHNYRKQSFMPNCESYAKEN